MVRVLVLLMSLLTFGVLAEEQGMAEIPGKVIYIDQLEDMFSRIRANTDWDMSGEMLWGYFFIHHEPAKLEAVKSVLESQGYRFVDIYLSEKEDPAEPDKYWLHVEKVEAHTPQSLDRRNDLYKLAHEQGLDSYDGMDVGPIEN
ncbi:ribonuclease E inhibitor RraB [Hahella ganghwensis]|uniref:ribonuclease E inhibitor RraB n=1 Tax=Hahella ganghwensis TaxID=286420 RepID=UPI000369FB59|nr:ribonuclease E inhibitor RraB [Hahella ganghwensis]